MINFDIDEQRAFLQFVTGSPRLPVGGQFVENILIFREMKRENFRTEFYFCFSVGTKQTYRRNSLPRHWNTMNFQCSKIRYSETE